MNKPAKNIDVAAGVDGVECWECGTPEKIVFALSVRNVRDCWSAPLCADCLDEIDSMAIATIAQNLSEMFFFDMIQKLKQGKPQ